MAFLSGSKLALEMYIFSEQDACLCNKTGRIDGPVCLSNHAHMVNGMGKLLNILGVLSPFPMLKCADLIRFSC